jgi:hypothetical protein
MLHATGIILGPSSILTIFTGPLEKLSRKIKTHKNLSPENFLVLTGLRNSGNLSDADEHTQISEVVIHNLILRS